MWKRRTDEEPVPYKYKRTKIPRMQMDKLIAEVKGHLPFDWRVYVPTFNEDWAEKEARQERDPQLMIVRFYEDVINEAKKYGLATDDIVRDVLSGPLEQREWGIIKTWFAGVKIALLYEVLKDQPEFNPIPPPPPVPDNWQELCPGFNKAKFEDIAGNVGKPWIVSMMFLIACVGEGLKHELINLEAAQQMATEAADAKFDNPQNWVNNRSRCLRMANRPPE